MTDEKKNDYVQKVDVSGGLDEKESHHPGDIPRSEELLLPLAAEFEEQIVYRIERAYDRIGPPEGNKDFSTIALDDTTRWLMDAQAAIAGLKRIQSEIKGWRKMRENHD